MLNSILLLVIGLEELNPFISGSIKNKWIFPKRSYTFPVIVSWPSRTTARLGRSGWQTADRKSTVEITGSVLTLDWRLNIFSNVWWNSVRSLSAAIFLKEDYAIWQFWQTHPSKLSVGLKRESFLVLTVDFKHRGPIIEIWHRFLWRTVQLLHLLSRGRTKGFAESVIGTRLVLPPVNSLPYGKREVMF